MVSLGLTCSVKMKRDFFGSKFSHLLKELSTDRWQLELRRSDVAKESEPKGSNLEGTDLINFSGLMG